MLTFVTSTDLSPETPLGCVLAMRTPRSAPPTVSPHSGHGTTVRRVTQAPKPLVIQTLPLCLGTTSPHWPGPPPPHLIL